MNWVIEFLPEAASEVSIATKYYETCTAGLGVRFRRQVESVCTAISEHPLLWRERSGGYRRVNLPGFPYYVAYFIRNERIVVAAIGHASRHPDYWKEPL